MAKATKEQQGITTDGARNKIVRGKFVMICIKCAKKTPNTVKGLCSDCFDNINETLFDKKGT